MCSLYDAVRKEGKREQSPEKRTVLLREDYPYKRVDGGEELVDLTRIGVYGLCCPEIVDMGGMAVLKECKLQPIHDGDKKVGYLGCGPLGYLNNWERCPVRRAAKGGKQNEV